MIKNDVQYKYRQQNYQSVTNWTGMSFIPQDYFKYIAQIKILQ